MGPPLTIKAASAHHVIKSSIEQDMKEVRMAEEEQKRELLLDFRTITTMLSGLQEFSPQVQTLSQPEGSPNSARKTESRILNALATLFVRRHEVVAVVSCGPHTYGSIEMVVVESSDHDDVTKRAESLAAQNGWHNSKIEEYAELVDDDVTKRAGYLAVQNARHDSKTTAWKTFPSITRSDIIEESSVTEVVLK